jgi:transcriptional regulator with XRE-family HTH domain
MAPKTPAQVVGVRVREHRDLQGLTQSQLADRLRDRLGWAVDRSLLARIEAGDRQVTVDELLRLAAALDTTPLLLMTPADETELMQALPWRPMTTSRVRAWIADEVPLWEQDRTAYRRSTAAAWHRSAAHDAAMRALVERIAAAYGVESIDEVDPEAELSDAASAMVDLLGLEIELEMRKHEWGQFVGVWAWDDPTSYFELLERHPRFTSEAAEELYGQRALIEIHDRHERLKESEVQTADGAALRVRGRVENVLAVFGELRDAVSERLASATPKRFELPGTRPDDDLRA